MRDNFDMNPVSWTQKRGFYMGKLNYEDKINLYKDKKSGVSTSSVSKKYGIRTSGVSYLVKLIDIHGFDILRTNKNKVHTKYEKQEAIDNIFKIKRTIKENKIKFTDFDYKKIDLN